MTKLSIIVPVYNAEPFLKKCFQSIESQTCLDFEVVVIDDGSTDRSGAICDAWAAKDSRFRVYHQENKGIGKTRETGLRKAAGRYIVWVDADDWIAQDLVEKVLRGFAETDADILVYGVQYVKKDKLEKILVFETQPLTEWRRQAILARPGVLWNFSSKKELWIGETVPSEAALAAEDGYLALRLFFKTKKIAALSHILYFHLDDAAHSVTHSMTGKKYGGMLFLFQERMKVCRQYFPDLLPFCASRAMSSGVKAFCLSLVDHSLNSEEVNWVQEALRTLSSEPVKGRFRDRFLAWCILHGHMGICRFYAERKYKKMKRANARIERAGR